MKEDHIINKHDDREEKLRSIFLAAPVGIGMVCNRVILEANDTLCRMTGYSKAEIIGKNSSFLYPTMDEYNYVGEEKYRQIRKTGIGTVETRWKKKDGTIIDIILSSSALDRGDFSRGVTFTALDITERKKTEKALAASELKFRTLIDKSPDAIFIADNNGIMHEFNRRVETMTGYTIDELSGKHIKAVHIDEEIPFALKKFNETLISGKVNFEFHLRRKDGEGIPVLMEADLLPDGRVIGYCRDISEIKKYEEQLSDYSKRIKTIADNIPELVYQFNVSNSGMGFTYMSERAADVFGIPTGSPDYLSEYITHIHPDYREKFITSTEESICRKSPWFCEWLYIHKSGETRWYRGRSNPEIKNNELIFYGVIQDITEEREAQIALISSEAKYRNLVELAVDGIMLGSNDGLIVSLNSQMEKMTGKKREELIGLHMSELFTEQSLKKRPLQFNLLKNGETIINERVLKRDDGINIIVETHSRMMPDGTFQSILRDVTEKQKLTESLQRAQKLDSLATLAGGIAHDFNNMLGGMLGYIDLARNYSKRVEDTAEYLDKAMTVFDRAKNLTGQLMTFARGGDPSLKTESIVPILTEYASSALSGSDIKHSFSIQDNLWLTRIDRSQIGQVIYNIVTNAREFMNPDGEITISAGNITREKSQPGQLKPGNYIKVEISDTGKGIPNDMLPHIFDPFFTTKKKGNGLGLSTSYSIIIKHGGSLDVESVYGKGSRFWFYLPAVMPGSGESPSTDSVKHKGSGIVLIMDDEYFIREIISQMLEHMGYRTFQASCGNELLGIYNSYKDNPDLKCIILDLTIPGGMGGKDTAEEIRKYDTKIPVIASSGYSSDMVMSDPGSYGFSDSIRKPFTVNELSVLLNRHLNSQVTSRGPSNNS